MTPGGGAGGGKLEGGIILAGWGQSPPPPCQHTARAGVEYRMTQSELDSFTMSFTKQTLARGGRGRRRPVLVSRTRSDPWRPAGTGQVRSAAEVSRDPFCSVCLNENLTEAEVEVRREMEREVKLIESKPSLAYRKHSPSNWTQENMIDDMKRDTKHQQKRLQELKKEYEEIEKRCTSKLIDDLASFDHRESPREKKKTIKSRSINIEILEDGTVKTSKVIPSQPRSGEEENSVGQSISISINSQSSRPSKHQPGKQPEAGGKVKEADGESDDGDCDTLNAVDSVHEDEISNSLLIEENANMKNENQALWRKYKKYKTLKNKIVQSKTESERQKTELTSLKAEMVRLAEENSQLKNRISQDQKDVKKLTRQNPIFEPPVRDVVHCHDQSVQVAVLDKDMQSFQVDYFTEVIIDELKKEIRELKDKVETKHENQQTEFRVQEENLILKLNQLKKDTERMRAAASKSEEMASDSSEVEKLKLETENLRMLLIQERQTSSTFESYINLLRQSYTTMFGPIN